MLLVKGVVLASWAWFGDWAPLRRAVRVDGDNSIGVLFVSHVVGVR